MDNYGKFEFVKIELLFVDYSYQRSNVSKAKIEDIVKNYNPRALGVIIVNKREDGRYYVTDGQHRVEALKIKGISHVPCLVQEGMAIEEEAEQFNRLNVHRGPVPLIAVFKARITAKDPEALKIKETIAKSGHRIDFTHTKNGIYAIGAILKVYNSGGCEAISEVLKIINLAWIGEREALKGEVIKGVYRFISAYKTEKAYDSKKLLSKLQKTPVTVLLRKAAGYVRLLGGNKDTNVGRAILEIYNYKLVNRLPDRFSKQ